MNIYKAALDVQDACNLSGVVTSFAKILGLIWEEARAKGKGTDYVNRHPVAILFADKINSLTGTQSSTTDYTVNEAYDVCLTRQEDEEVTVPQEKENVT